ncbi:MAG: hypothetical protein R3B36_00555 [Polyangiaceae bacterium]
MDDDRPPTPERIMHIDEAPNRIRREHYRRERRNSAIAVLVIATAVALLAWGVWWCVHAFLRS